MAEILCEDRISGPQYSREKGQFLLVINAIAGLENLTAIILTRCRIDMVGAVQFARFFIFDIDRRLQSIGRATKAPLHAGNLAFWDSHFIKNSIYPQPKAPLRRLPRKRPTRHF